MIFPRRRTFDGPSAIVASLCRNQTLTTLFSHSRQAIKKYVTSNNKITFASQGAFDAQFNKAIKAGVEKGEFTQPKGKFQLPCYRAHYYSWALCIHRLLLNVYIPARGILSHCF